MQSVAAAFLLLCTLVYVHGKPSDMDAPCGNQGMAKYNLTFEVFWTESTFPKQYPTFRPHAQWAKLIGRTHSSRYRLWEEDALATRGVQEYAEKGTTEILDLETQGTNGILDIFNAGSMDKGEGKTSVKILMDPYHSKVSLMSRLVPSPDWFVGANSVELCKNGEWVNSVKQDLPPFDAGTDRGFTFTAPNWPEVPYKKIYQITSTTPNHPANSFFYPEWNALPSIASMTLVKVETIEMDKDSDFRRYKDAGALNDDTGIKRYRPQEPAVHYEQSLGEVMKSSSLSNTLPKTNQKPQAKQEFSLFRTDMRPKPYTSKPEMVTAPDTRKTYNNPQRTDFPVACQVGEWQEWSSCSKTCGYGTRIRTRLQIVAAQNGGSPCQGLREEELCGSMRSCTWSHFNTFGGSSRKKTAGRRTMRRRKPRRKTQQERQRRY